MGSEMCIRDSLPTAHEHVVNSYIDAYMYIHFFAFAVDSYQESKPGNEERKSEASGSYRVTKHHRNRHIHGLKESRL